MNCKDCTHLIETYLEGELNEHVFSAFERHLASCEECRMDVNSIDKCISVMQTAMEDVTPPDTIRKGILEKLGCCEMKSVCYAPPKNKE